MAKSITSDQRQLLRTEAIRGVENLKPGIYWRVSGVFEEVGLFQVINPSNNNGAVVGINLPTDLLNPDMWKVGDSLQATSYAHGEIGLVPMFARPTHKCSCGDEHEDESVEPTYSAAFLVPYEAVRF